MLVVFYKLIVLSFYSVGYTKEAQNIASPIF